MTDTNNSTHVIFVIDRSGSMFSIKEDAEGGIKEFLQTQSQDTTTELNVSLIEFDSIIETVFTNKPINQVPDYHLNPRGATALLDATSTGLSLAEQDDPNTTTLLVIVTDGQENSSQETTYSQIKERIDKFKTNDNKEVLFLAANIDTAAESNKLGINTSLSYQATGAGVRSVYSSVSNYVTERRAGNKEARL